MTKAIGGLLAAVLAVIFTCAAGLTLVFGGPATGCTAPVLGIDSAAAAISPPAGGWQPIGTWDADQRAAGRPESPRPARMCRYAVCQGWSGVVRIGPYAGSSPGTRPARCVRGREPGLEVHL